MPSFPFSQALTASQKNFNPLSGWQYEFLPWPGDVAVLMRHTGAAGTVVATIYSGSETIQQRSPIQNGGTAGVTPSTLNTHPTTWRAAAGDRIIISIDETAAATPTVDGIIIVEPAY